MSAIYTGEPMFAKAKQSNTLNAKTALEQNKTTCCKTLGAF